MGHAHGLSIEEQRKVDKKVGFKGFWILLIVTFGEVGVALLGKKMGIPPMILRLVMIGLSLFKAYYIVSIFMHLGHEVRGMAMSIILPLTLLIWAVIAFLWEGESVRHNRNYVNDGDPLKKEIKPSGDIISMNSHKDLSGNISFK